MGFFKIIYLAVEKLEAVFPALTIKEKILMDLRVEDLTIVFESPELKYGLLNNNAAPKKVSYAGWTIQDSYVANKYSEIREGLGGYKLLVERQLSQGLNLNEEYSIGVELCERIEKIWPYVSAMPFGVAHFGSVLQIQTPPNNWTSNFDQIEADYHKAIKSNSWGKISARHNFWTFGDRFFVEGLVRGLEAYDNISALAVELINIHYEAYHNPSVRPLLMSKALEIVREILPGKTDKQKELALPQELKNHKETSLGKLYELSNKRLDTRHPLTKKPSVALYNAMEGKEYQDFIEDSDCVIRAVICAELNLPYIKISKGEPKKNDNNI